jgi:hypothetical protein
VTAVRLVLARAPLQQQTFHEPQQVNEVSEEVVAASNFRGDIALEQRQF